MFLKWLELDHDPFLDNLDPFNRTPVIGAFADAYWLGRFPLLLALIHEHQALVATPSTLWLRPTRLTGVAAPGTIPAASSPNFYRTK